MSQKVKERWVYAGERQGEDILKVHRWRVPGMFSNNPEGPDDYLSFARLKAAIIGGVYEVHVTRSDDMAFQSVIRDATWTGERIDDQLLIAQWTADDRATKTVITRGRLERKVEKEDAFEDAVKPLKDMMNSLGTNWPARSAFVAMVIDALYRG